MKDSKSNKNYYALCVDKYHEMLQNEEFFMGYDDPIEVPELLSLGEEIIIRFLNDVALKNTYRNDDFQYRYVLVSMCIQAGVVYASTWCDDKENYASIVNKLIEEKGVGNACQTILWEEFEWHNYRNNKVYSAVFEDWNELIEESWDLNSRNEYMIASLLAAFQFGMTWYLSTSPKYEEEWEEVEDTVDEEESGSKDSLNRENVDNLPENYTFILRYLVTNYAEELDEDFGKSKKILTIPELAIEAPLVMNNIISEMAGYFEKKGSQPNIKMFGLWSFLAGVGAVKLWDQDWNELKRVGIYNKLTEVKGIFAMDEYVLDLIGVEYEPDEWNPFSGFAYGMAEDVLGKFMTDIEDDNMFMKRIMDINVALYNFGISYEMYQLGMR